MRELVLPSTSAMHLPTKLSSESFQLVVTLISAQLAPLSQKPIRDFFSTSCYFSCLPAQVGPVWAKNKIKTTNTQDNGRKTTESFSQANTCIFIFRVELAFLFSEKKIKKLKQRQFPWRTKKKNFNDRRRSCDFVFGILWVKLQFSKEP